MPRLIYVHGLGGEPGGNLDKALHRHCRPTWEFVRISWPSGTMVGNAARLAADVLTYPTPPPPRQPRTGNLSTIVDTVRQIHALGTSLRNATRSIWLQAAAAVDQAGRDLATALAMEPEPVTLVGFSLGCRVISRALDDRTARRRVARVVLLAAAIPIPEASNLGSADLDLVNVYSPTDRALAMAYPLVAESPVLAAGLGPVPNARNHTLPRLDHHTYIRYAPTILRWATESQAPIPE